MTAKVDEAVRALLEHLARLSQHPPSSEELEDAKVFLSDGFLLNLETVGSVADLATRLEVLGLPDDYYDTYRAAVRELGHLTRSSHSCSCATKIDAIGSRS